MGRSARLELVFAVRHGRTVLLHGYAEPPLRVGRPFADGDGLHLILASSAPGVFGHDLFDQRIVLEAGAQVRLTSQSAMQVHPGIDGGVARVRSTFVVGEDAGLRCHWDPVIPFGNSRFDQRSVVSLAASASLAWSEALMAGRTGHGERWQFASVRQELRVTRGRTLEYLERYQIVPAEARVQAPWVAGECCYFGTALTLGATVDVTRAEALHTELGAIPGLHAAVDRLGTTGLLGRVAARHGPCFHTARALLSAL